MLLLMMLYAPVKAQWIHTLKTYPANPTTADNVLLIADVSFSSGTCESYTHNFSQAGNDFYAYSIHCVGPLTYICNATDTFDAGILPAGTYQFNYSVDEGFGPLPCTPGIVAGPSASLSFTVGTATGITDPANPLNPDFYIKDKHLYLRHPEKLSGMIYIYNTSGQLVVQRTTKENSGINLGTVAPGIYTAVLRSGNDQAVYRFMLR